MHSKYLLGLCSLVSSVLGAPSVEKRALPWFVGINLSGAEFGEGKYPGVYNTDYTWYTHSEVDQFVAQGFNLFRINFAMERMTVGSLYSGLDKGYVGNLTDIVNYITQKGAYAMIQPHNYGRFNGQIITDTNGFQSWWKQLAAVYKSNAKVIFDTNNEYHDMDQTLILNLNQAAINGIRAAGATSQYITPEGNCYSGAYSWVTCNNDNLKALTDSQNKIIYQMHQYLDSDNSGSHTECVSSTIFQERLSIATNWLRSNKKQGLIGEFGAGNNTQCITALQGGLNHLKQNSDVWTGAAWWAAGPWWGDYIYSMEPTTGTAWRVVLPKIKSSWFK
ncbi:hypothetical protein ACN47E_000579 [Coniothyrium glycines]